MDSWRRLGVFQHMECTLKQACVLQLDVGVWARLLHTFFPYNTQQETWFFNQWRGLTTL